MVGSGLNRGRWLHLSVQAGRGQRKVHQIPRHTSGHWTSLAGFESITSSRRAISATWPPSWQQAWKVAKRWEVPRDSKTLTTCGQLARPAIATHCCHAGVAVEASEWNGRSSLKC